MSLQLVAYLPQLLWYEALCERLLENSQDLEHGEDTLISQPEVQSENTPVYLEDLIGILILLLSYFIYSEAFDMILSLTFWSLSIYVCVGFLCETISLLSGPKQFSRNYW